MKPEDSYLRKLDVDMIARALREEYTDTRGMKAAAEVRSELSGTDKSSGERERTSRVIADLANTERYMLRTTDNSA